MAKIGSDMSMINNGFRLLSASTLVLATVFTMPGIAHAQLFFDWGGGTEKVNDSGRQSVRINSDAKPGEIIVSFTDRKLYLMTAPGRAISYPVAIPREQDRWEGKTTVTQKRENPSWTPTPTMIKENPKLPRWVPGGHPMNPLGNRALYLGSSFYRIHGTDAPWTIGTAVSKGCIRMYNKDALDVYEQSKVGARVLVTWNAYQTTPDGQAPQAAAAQDEAPASPRASFGGSSRRNADAPSQPASAVPAATVAGPATTVPPRRTESRYSDIFGTPEPSAPAAASRPAAEGEPARAARPARERENQQQREPRKSRDAATERVRAEPAKSENTKPENTGGTEAVPARPKAAEQRQRSQAAVDTASPTERRAKPKTVAPEKAATPEQIAAPTQTQAAVAPAEAPQPDAATRALEAAERAAAAAERAAAAAERAEKAMAARAAAASIAPAAASLSSPVPAAGGGD